MMIAPALNAFPHDTKAKQRMAYLRGYGYFCNEAEAVDHWNELQLQIRSSTAASIASFTSPGSSRLEH
ncbi:hypothetical protein [Tunturiibacter gelidiferens]|uniref:hypothetical protein n=1 Tax=Tunturiibacter gelidiferens TaxID=3069689 RepID=UPI003D9B310E